MKAGHAGHGYGLGKRACSLSVRELNVVDLSVREPDAEDAVGRIDHGSEGET